jgi:hypothetical protein
MHNYRNGIPLPNKMGSFQLFLKGFKDATTFFRSGYDQVYKNADGVGSPQGMIFLIISSHLGQQESTANIRSRTPVKLVSRYPDSIPTGI